MSVPISTASPHARSHPKVPPGVYSVGRVARETGIAPGTLRVWERRYGNPVPVRLPSGHRRYTEGQLRYLRRIAEGLARGLRPGALLKLPAAELERVLLGAEDERPAAEIRRAWTDLVRRMDGDALRDLLARESQRVSALEFLEGFLGPFLTEIGRAWAEGEIEIRHEHFTTELVQDHLRTLRDRQEQAFTASTGKRIVLGTLPTERHSIGLLMVCLLAQEQGFETRLLGPDNPVSEIARAAIEMGAAVLGISVSLAGGGPDTDRRLSELRRLVPPEIHIVVGGAGARRGRRGPKGVVACEGLEALQGWLRKFPSPPGPAR